MSDRRLHNLIRVLTFWTHWNSKFSVKMPVGFVVTKTKGRPVDTCSIEKRIVNLKTNQLFGPRISNRDHEYNGRL